MGFMPSKIWTQQPQNINRISHPAFSGAGTLLYLPWIAQKSLFDGQISFVGMSASGNPTPSIVKAGRSVNFTASNSDAVYKINSGAVFKYPCVTIAVASSGPTTGSLRHVFGVSSYPSRWTGLRFRAASNTWEYQCYGGNAVANCHRNNGFRG